MNLWGQVIALRGQILVSRTDDATLRVLCCVLCVCSLCVVCVVGVQCVGVGWCWCVTLTPSPLLSPHNLHTTRTHHDHNDTHTTQQQPPQQHTETRTDRDRERDKTREDKKTREDEREDEGCFFFSKNVSEPSNPSDELALNVSKKTFSDELFLLFSSKVQNLTFFQLFLHDSNSIFRAAGINSEWVSGGTVRNFNRVDGALPH